MDELWSFVADKGNEQWVWLALDVETRETVGCHIGDRRSISQSPLVVITCRLLAVHTVLQRFLGVLSGGIAKQTTSSCRQGNGIDQLH